jgi:hypothetical protein
MFCTKIMGASFDEAAWIHLVLPRPPQSANLIAAKPAIDVPEAPAKWV